jgi:hypothetical protein
VWSLAFAGESLGPSTRRVFVHVPVNSCLSSSISLSVPVTPWQQQFKIALRQNFLYEIMSAFCLFGRLARLPPSVDNSPSVS